MNATSKAGQSGRRANGLNTNNSTEIKSISQPSQTTTTYCSQGNLSVLIEFIVRFFI